MRHRYKQALKMRHKAGRERETQTSTVKHRQAGNKNETQSCRARQRLKHADRTFVLHLVF